MTEQHEGRRPRNVSLPAALDRELVDASELTGIPVSRILQQGARIRLDQLRAEAQRIEAEATRALREKRRAR